MDALIPPWYGPHNSAQIIGYFPTFVGVKFRIVGCPGISQTSDNEIAINNLSIEVSAMQFAFLFNYPKGNFISGELHVPVDQKVSMKMESKDVIHAFWVPEFRIKQDIIPGQPTILNFTPTKVGKYPIICAELCGPYHGGMRASIIVEEESDYNNWFNKNKKTEVNL